MHLQNFQDIQTEISYNKYLDMISIGFKHAFIQLDKY